MSVPEGLRKKGKMEIHVKAQALAVYTIKILSNKKIFNPDVDSELIRRIKTCALDIYSKAWTANGLRGDADPEERNTRYRLQREAQTLCGEMLLHINLSKTVFHLKSKRIKYWSEQIREISRLLQAWKESDIKRFGKPKL